jgi:hypothetical protein
LTASLFSTASNAAPSLSRLLNLITVPFISKKQKDSTTNLDFIINYFNSGDTAKTTKASRGRLTLILSLLTTSISVTKTTD